MASFYDVNTGDRLFDAEFMKAQQENLPLLELYKELLPLKSTLKFMTIGAHPDDELTPLLSYLRFHEGISIAVTCANRGQGGQNAIGYEYLQELGALRTNELISACKATSSELFFLDASGSSSISDFGFAKTAAETIEKWGGENAILKPLVKAIRSFKPDIIFTSFLDVDGQHGHHRAMYHMMLKAFELAANKDFFDGMPAWQVSKLYIPADSALGLTYADSTEPPEATVIINSGRYNNVFGATYAQIAEQSRAYHKTQSMGVWRYEEPLPVKLHLLQTSGIAKADNEQTIADGLSSNLAQLADSLNNAKLANDIQTANDYLQKAIAAWPNHDLIKENLKLARPILDNAKQQVSDLYIADRLAEKINQLDKALALSYQLKAYIEADYDIVNAGESIDVKLHIFNGSDSALHDCKLMPKFADYITCTPNNFKVSQLQASEFCTLEFTLNIDSNAPLDNPFYFSLQDMPKAYVKVICDNQTLQIPCLTKKLHVLPEVSIMAENSDILSKVDDGKFELSLVATSYSKTPVSGDITLNINDKWQVKPSKHSINLDGFQKQSKLSFHIDASATKLQEGTSDITILYNGAPASYVKKISYSHIDDIYLISDTKVRYHNYHNIQATEKISYIEGGSDNVATVLKDMNYDVTLIAEDNLSTFAINDFDVIIIGIMAYRKQALYHINNKLLDWVKNGGRLIVQYQRPWENWQENGTAPWYLKLGTPSFHFRITDENAKVNILDSQHQLFNFPNKIEDKDWQGWIKERGLYFASDWDETNLKSLVSMQDYDGKTLKGALLYGDYGKGSYIYVGLNLFFQLQNYVSGSMKLWQNLITKNNK